MLAARAPVGFLRYNSWARAVAGEAPDSLRLWNLTLFDYIPLGNYFCLGLYKAQEDFKNSSFIKVLRGV